MMFHATLSPSSSKRWLNCPGSVQAVKDAPASAKGTNVYAEDGLAAHALFEICNRTHADPVEFIRTKLHKDIVISEDMVEAVGHGIDYVRGYMRRHPNAKLRIEHPVPSGKLIGLSPSVMSGTPDVTLEDWPRECVVLDYKHGAGVSIEVKNNSQLMIYHGGVRARKGAFNRYCNVIVQPRARHRDGPIREWTFSDKYLMNWMATTIAPAARAALRKNAPRIAGDWCDKTFCPAARDCRALAQAVFERAQMRFGVVDQKPKNPNNLTDKEVAYAIEQSHMIERWLKEIRAAAFERMMAGHKIKDLKLVYGRRSRGWRDDQKVLHWLETLSWAKPDEYAPRNLLSPHGLEVVFKRRKKLNALARLNKFVVFHKPPIHVAPASDPREAYRSGASRFKPVKEKQHGKR